MPLTFFNVWPTSNKNDTFNGANLLPHEWLCVRQNATSEEINENYRKLALATHPDKNNKCSDKLFTDNDQQMQLAFEPFTAVFNKPKYQVIADQLNTMPKSAGDCTTVGYDVFLVNTLIEDAKNFALEAMFKAYKKALESKFVCKVREANAFGRHLLLPQSDDRMPLQCAKLLRHETRRVWQLHLIDQPMIKVIKNIYL
ncbi:hypothetical protein niasHT_010411 [Heterodera trifolii]|uniref:J domain-containing protein n=1 Tax=Heterodera trifolii TaxID=157864 RepID=A0ABD2MD01_9BILA